MKNKIIIIILLILSVFVNASSDDIVVIVQDTAPVIYKEYIIEMPLPLMETLIYKSVTSSKTVFDSNNYDDNNINSNTLDDKVTITEISAYDNYESRSNSDSSSHSDVIYSSITIKEPVNPKNELITVSSITGLEDDIIQNVNVEGIYNNYFYLAVGEHYDYDWDFADPSNPSAGWDLYGTYDDTFVISSDQTLPAYSNVFDEYMSWSTNWQVTQPMSAGTSSSSEKSGDYLSAILQNGSIEVREIYNLPPYSSSWFQKGYVIKNIGAFNLTNVKFIQLFDIGIGGTFNDADDVSSYNPATDSITLSDSINTYEAGVSDSKIGTITVYPNIQSSYHSVGNTTDIYRNQISVMQLDNSDNYNNDDPLNKESYSSVAYQFNIDNLEPGQEKEIIFTIKVNMGTDREMADLAPEWLGFSDNEGVLNISFDVFNYGNISASNFEIKLYEIAPNNDILQEKIIKVENPIEASDSNFFSTVFNVKEKNEVYIYVDSGYSVFESKEDNNYIRQKYHPLNVFVKVNSSLTVLDSLYLDYVESKLKYYNIVESETLADYVITVGNNNYNTLAEYDWGVKDGNLKLYDKYENLPYNGLINSFEEGDKINIVIMGNAVEGMVAALRAFDYEDLENNKDNYIERTNLDALGTFDYFNLPENKVYYMQDNNDFRNITHIALLGGFEFTQELVKTADLSMTLRLKHIKPSHSSYYNQVLDASNSEIANFSSMPVVISRGLWSNLTTWKKLGTELASTGRDVWLIEITGGPNQDCETCYDYTFDDLVDSYWPALIGGVEAYTGQNKIQYVGFSNGGRIALSSLDKYNDIGKANAGKYWDGNSWETSSMSPRVVDHLIAVATPGAFEGLSPFKVHMDINGEYGVRNIRNQNISHVSAVKAVFLGFKESLIGTEGYISTNLLDRYVYFANNEDDVQPGQNITVNKFTVMRGHGGSITKGTFVTSDGIVTKYDMDSIFGGVNSSNKRYYKIAGGHFGYSIIPSVADRMLTIRLLEKELNNKEIPMINKCYNLIDPMWWCIW